MTTEQEPLGDGRISEDLIQAYVDGRLEPTDRLAVEIYLASHPKEADRVTQYARQNQTLHQLYDPYLTEPPSAGVRGLERHIANELWERRHPWRTLGRCLGRIFGRLAGSGLRAPTALAVAASIAVAAGGYSLMGAPEIGTDDGSLRANASNASATERDTPFGAYPILLDIATLHPAERENNDGTQPDRAIEPPDLDELGFELVATRQLAGPDTAQFRYAAEDGRQVLLYVDGSANADPQSFRLRHEGVISVVAWADDQRSYTLIGEIPRLELLLVGLDIDGGTEERNAGPFRTGRPRA